ncbi:MAG: metal ABC transporter permease [Rubrivivax sp.]|nr:metal ABC transporter permease [Rubrivivax sp.]
MDLLAPFTEFAFLQNALWGCLALSLSAPPVGVFLMLRRMSLTGDAMAHAILPGAAIGYLVAGLSLGAMTLGGLVAGLAVVALSGAVSRSTVLREDTSLAAFYLLSLALGVVIISSQGRNVDLLHVLFGSVLALDGAAVAFLAGVAAVTLATLVVLYRPLVLECLDPAFLRAVSRWSPVAHYGFLALLVLNLVAGFQALGTLLAVGMMILPAAAARFWVRDLKPLLAAAVGVSALGSVLGLVLSYHLDAPSGPSIVLTLGGLYLLSIVFGPRGALRARRVPAHHLKA